MEKEEVERICKKILQDNGELTSHITSQSSNGNLIYIHLDFEDDAKKSISCFEAGATLAMHGVAEAFFVSDANYKEIPDGQPEPYPDLMPRDVPADDKKSCISIICLDFNKSHPSSITMIPYSNLTMDQSGKRIIEFKKSISCDVGPDVDSGLLPTLIYKGYSMMMGMKKQKGDIT